MGNGLTGVSYLLFSPLLLDGVWLGVLHCADVNQGKENSLEK